MGFKRKIYRWSMAFLAILILLLGTAGGIGWLYRDELTQTLISQLNNRLKTPVHVQEINMSLFEAFPDISVVFKNVLINGTLKNDRDTLLYAAEFSAAFNIINIINKDYSIEKVKLKKGLLYLSTTKGGETNYNIFRKDTSSEKSLFKLKSILLQDVRFRYHDRRLAQYIDVDVHSAKASGTIDGYDMRFRIDSDLQGHQVQINESNYLSNRRVKANLGFRGNFSDKILTFEQGSLSINEATYLISGDIDYGKKTLNLNVNADHTTIGELLSLLPNKYAEMFRHYKSKGQVDMGGVIAGSYKGDDLPVFDFDIQCNDGQLFHPDYNKKLENISFTGGLYIGPDKSRNAIIIKNLTCVLEQETLSGDLIITTFTEPELITNLKGRIQLASFFSIFPLKYVNGVYGYADVDCSIRYPLGSSSADLKSEGQASLHNVSFLLNKNRLPINNLNGDLGLRGNTISITSLTGNIGESDFTFNGYIRDFKGLLAEDQKIDLQANLESNLLDFNELLQTNFGTREIEESSDNYSFNVSPNMLVDVHCRAKRLKFKRFDGHNASGYFKINNSIVIFEDLKCSAMGGDFDISGSFDTRLNDKSEWLAYGLLNGLYLDSIFYVFNNFKQDFIVSDNLKGRIYADVNTYVPLTKELDLISDRLRAELTASVRNGELINFEPLQSLSGYVEEKSLAHVRFSDLQNDIRIENSTVYLPDMTVISNISSFKIRGTHSFDQEIYYQVAIPMNKVVRLGKLKAGSLKDDKERSHLLLVIKGTTEDYSVALDSRRMFQSITKDFRDEKQELHEAFSSEAAKEAEVKEEDHAQLEEDEYFDFEVDK